MDHIEKLKAEFCNIPEMVIEAEGKLQPNPHASDERLAVILRANIERAFSDGARIGQILAWSFDELDFEPVIVQRAFLELGLPSERAIFIPYLQSHHEPLD